MALGAASRDVLRLVLAMGGKLLIVGVAAGLALSLALVRFVRGQFIQFPQPDVVTLSAVVLVLCGVGLLACFIPARRAARLDANSALRHE
jgi:ABC-type antimicrobial peptide transport system permease subunit